MKSGRASARPASELAMMVALAEPISRATRINVDVEILEVLLIFSAAGLLVSLVAAIRTGLQRNLVMKSFHRASNEVGDALPELELFLKHRDVVA
jgi:hypothetical protein